MRTSDEADGGDPPCWAHPFDDIEVQSDERRTASEGRSPRRAVPDEGGPADLVAVTRAAASRGPAWTHRSDDLDVNLLVFGAGEGVAEHVNAEVDVLLVGVLGEGVVTIDDRAHPVGPGRAVLIPKGARRGTRASGERFSYLTCHRRRPGLWPTAGCRVGAKDPAEG